MNNQYFNLKDTLFCITENYKETIEVFSSFGFDNLKDEDMRQQFGKMITLEAALQLKQIDSEVFEEKLLEAITTNKNNIKENENKQEIKIAGILPCPVRVPLTDAFEKWIADKEFDFHLSYELKAASMGIDWLMDTLKNQTEKELPDLFISAGFDMFFDKNLFGKYKAENLFEDITGFTHYNEDFHNDYLKLEDPSKQYSIIGVVPAVFLVNVEELNGRKMPQSWEDILSEEFEGSVSLPVGDFDLFNAILLNIYKCFKDEGVRKLGKCLQRSMHPSEMVKSHIKKQDKPAITIMPYFFTKLVKDEGPMKAIWPQDGAIISPIFMLSKKEKKKELKPIVDFFASKDVGEILSHNGRFPSVNPFVDNQIPKENKYMWLGWEYLKEQDISILINKCEVLFNQGKKEENE